MFVAEILFSGESIGAVGERAAVRFLQARGFTLVARNVRTRGGEIDAVMRKEGVVYFVEVKTRREGNRTEAGGEIAARKWRRMRRVISWYVTTHEIEEWRGLAVIVRISADERRAKISVLDI